MNFPNILLYACICIIGTLLLYKIYRLFSKRNRIDVEILPSNRKCEKPYKNWKLHGEAKLYHPNGMIARIEKYEYGKLINPIQTFNDKGEEDLKIFFNKTENTTKEEHYKQNILVFENEIKNEEKITKERKKTYSINGTIKSDEYTKSIEIWSSSHCFQGGFIKERIEGRYLEYDDYGILKSEVVIKNKNQKNIKFYSSGKLVKEENYFDDK